MVSGVGIIRCVADILRNDVLSVPASSISLQFPNDYPAASGVPTFMYTCLKDIWLQGTTASGATPLQWSTYIVDTLGLGQSGTRSIEVVLAKEMDSIGSPRGFIKDNSLGAKYGEFIIYLKLGGAITPLDSERIVQAERRIYSLIDYNFRVNTLGNTKIPVTDDTIDPNYDNKCYCQGAAGKASGLTDKDMAVYYCAAYRVNVPRKF